MRQEVQRAGAAEHIYIGELRQESAASNSWQLQESSRINVLEQQSRQHALDEQTAQQTIQQLREVDTRNRDDSSRALLVRDSRIRSLEAQITQMAQSGIQAPTVSDPCFICYRNEATHNCQSCQNRVCVHHYQSDF